VQDSPFMLAVTEICKRDARYHVDAYLFTREALDYTVRALKKSTKATSRHITAKELLEGIRAFALQEFGPMTLTVMEAWGIARTGDFGEIVFNLVEAGKLGKTEEDRKEDFADVFDFYESFARPFLPRAVTEKAAPSSPRTRRRAAASARNAPDVEKKQGEHHHG
jgi:uncharacterized repeat protein (TIGR04138 family)